MSGVSLPVTRPSGQALLVSNPASRAQVFDSLQRLGYGCAEADDPYAAMAELCRRPLAYQAVILSLSSLYQEELAVIRAIKRRYPHVEIWLTHTDGRQAALAEAMRLGADGLVSEDGLHRIALGGLATNERSLSLGEIESLSAGTPGGLAAEQEPLASASQEADAISCEPILTADELKALLQEQPSIPPSGEE